MQPHSLADRPALCSEVGKYHYPSLADAAAASLRDQSDLFKVMELARGPGNDLTPRRRVAGDAVGSFIQ